MDRSCGVTKIQRRKCSSFIRYPGGKSKLQSEIASCLAQLAKQTELQYREPFFGGGSIGLNMLSNPKIVDYWLNDKDVGIACLWTSVICYPDELIEMVLSCKPSVEMFHELKEELGGIDEMPTQRDEVVKLGFNKLVIHQISYSGLGTKSGGPLGGAKQQSECKIDSRWSPQSICDKVDLINKQFGKVKVHGGCCTNHDFDVMIQDTTCDALLYLDPPYYVKGNSLYQHGFGIEDHKRLASNLKASKHAWVLSYDDCPEVRKLYEWANIDELNVNYSITGLKDKETGVRKSRKGAELLISPVNSNGCITPAVGNSFMTTRRGHGRILPGIRCPNDLV